MNTFLNKDFTEYGTKVKRLGSGTYGKVFLCKTKEGKFYAIKKRYDTDLGNDFIREVSILWKLNHPNIIKIIDVYILENKMHIVLPYMEGTLEQIKKYTIRNEEVCKDISRQLLSGMSYLHNMGVLHRDIKPSNILYEKVKDFDSESNIKFKICLADFGLARTRSQSKQSFTNTVYTLWFRAPEVILGKKYDEKAEIWALGCVLFQMYYGFEIFTGYDEPTQLLEQLKKIGIDNKEDWIADFGEKTWKDEYFSFKGTVFNKELNSFEKFIFWMLTICPSKRPDVFRLYNYKIFGDNVENPQKTILERFRENSIDMISLPSNHYIHNERKMLIEWMIEVAVFNGYLRCLSMAIYLTDKYILDNNITDKKEYQKIGSASLFIASNFEYNYGFMDEKLEEMSDHCFEISNLVEMEQNILKTLPNLLDATHYHFLMAFIDEYNLEPHRNSILYIMMCSMTSPIALFCKPEKLAISILLLSCKYLGIEVCEKIKADEKVIRLILDTSIPIDKNVIKYNVNVSFDDLKKKLKNNC